jgi:nitrate reductase NapAB chaperone NapD
MPIGGFVITCNPGDKEAVLQDLAAYTALEVHGTDDKGNIVAVVDTETGDEMDSLVSTLQKKENILAVDLAYLHAEDEVNKIISGEIKPKGFFGGRKK